MRAMLPAAARRALGLERQRLVIDLEGDAGKAYLVTGTDFRREAGFDLNAGPDGIATLCAMAESPLDEIVLRLASDVVLEKTLKLPAGARRDIAAIVPFELQRTVPLPADRMFYDFVATPAGASLEVRVQIAERSAVLGAADSLVQVGIVADRVLGGAGAPDFPDLERFTSLLPAERRPAPRSTGLNRVLAVAAVLSVVLAIAGPFASLAVERRGLERSLAMTPATGAAEQTLENRARRVAQRKASAPFVTVMLDDLTRLLPDDVWLSQLNWVDGQIEIEGVSRSAASLVPRIEASGKFGKVEFQTPVVRDPVAGGERFHFAILPKTPGAP